MIGQDKLTDRITNEEVPKSNLIIGEKGAGKHTLIKEICARHNLDCVDITDNISKDLIDDLYISPVAHAYIIDIVELSAKSRYINKENAVLKFIEEPPSNSVIFIVAEYESQVIDTIKNRCVVWKFSPYNINDLRQFRSYENDFMYFLLDTPGKILTGKDEDYYISLFKICNSVIDNIDRANVSNTLSLEKHMRFVNEDGYDLTLFLICMKYLLRQRILQSSSQEDIDAFDLTRQFIEWSHILNVNERHLFDNYILTLKSIYEKS